MPAKDLDLARSYLAVAVSTDHKDVGRMIGPPLFSGVYAMSLKGSIIVLAAEETAAGFLLQTVLTGHTAPTRESLIAAVKEE